MLPGVVRRALGVLLAATLGCGGGGRATPGASAARPGGPDAGAVDGGAVPGAAFLPGATLPEVTARPVTTLVTSRRADLRARDGAAACLAAQRAAGEPPAREVAKLGAACAGVTRMAPASAVLEGRQSAAAPPTELPFVAEAGTCYRLVAAAGAGIRTMSVLLRDEDGAVAAESIASAPLQAAPRDGAACFTVASRGAIVVSVGDGDGAFAVQLLAGK